MPGASGVLKGKKMDKDMSGLFRCYWEEVQFVGEARLREFADKAQKLAEARAALRDAEHVRDEAEALADSNLEQLATVAGEIASVAAEAAKRDADAERLYQGSVALAREVSGDRFGEAGEIIWEIMRGQRELCSTYSYEEGRSTYVLKLSVEQRKKFPVPRFTVKRTVSGPIAERLPVGACVGLADAEKRVAAARADYHAALQAFADCVRTLDAEIEAEGESLAAAQGKQVDADRAFREKAEAALRDAQATLASLG